MGFAEGIIFLEKGPDKLSIHLVRDTGDFAGGNPFIDEIVHETIRNDTNGVGSAIEKRFRVSRIRIIVLLFSNPT